MPPLLASSEDAVGLLQQFGTDPGAPGSSRLPPDLSYLGSDPSNALLPTPGSAAGGFAGDPHLALNTRRGMARLQLLQQRKAGLQKLRASRDQLEREDLHLKTSERRTAEGIEEAQRASASKAESAALVSRL